MEVIRVDRDNYDLHSDVMTMTRRYRHQHLWSNETDTDLTEEYKLADREKVTFVALIDNSFAGEIK